MVTDPLRTRSDRDTPDAAARRGRGDTEVRNVRRAWRLLESVPDPEIPVLSVVDLGIVRHVVESDDGRCVSVTLTPTYSGCPATEVIQRDVRAALEAAYDVVDLRVQLSPAWTTDWMTDAGRDKLRGFGIAPPSGRGGAVDLGATIGRLDSGDPVGAGDPGGTGGALDAASQPEACPRCGSREVEELAGFGSTPCKALWRCTACREPFDYFKRH